MGSRILPNKTWFIDIDGTIFNHKSNFDFDESDKIYDQILEGVEEFWEKIPADDYIILTTARPGWWKEMTIYSLEKFGLRYDQLMELGWKRMIPLSLVWLILSAIVLGLREFGLPWS